jgi:protein SCO1/2
VRRAIGDLSDDRAERVDLAMITVDPERDDAERLTAYAQTFVADARALRTDDFDLLDHAAAAYGASYEISTTESGDVDVGHTAFLYAVDAAGAIRLTWTFGTPPEDLTSDLNYLFDQGV